MLEEEKGAPKAPIARQIELMQPAAWRRVTSGHKGYLLVSEVPGIAGLRVRPTTPPIADSIP